LPHPELAAEQEYIEQAYEQLEAMRESARRRIAAVIGQGRGITHQAREERDVIVRSSLQRLEQLDIGREALCFGRIDEEQGDKFYVGRLAVSGPDHEPLVVDWRAPVAEPFYRATGANPMGLSRRRHFLTDGPELLAVEDEVFADEDIGSATIGGILVSTLERARTGRMRDIIATIQREQDEIIRAPLTGLLIVQGGPGTGKTAVALHRAAYLLYTHRFPLERQGVLVVGPNQVFLRYIESVLPSLGESGAVLTTLSGLVPEVRVRAQERPGLAALKGQARMAAVVKAAVANRQRPLRRDLEVPFGPYVLRIAAEQSAGIVRAGRRRHGPHNARRRHVEAELFRRLHERYLELAGRPPVRPADEELADVIPLFADEPGFGDVPLDQAELRSRLRHHPAVTAALDRMWPRLLPEELLHDLFGARALLALAGRGHLEPSEVDLLYRPRSDSLEAIPWTGPDLALIDEAKVLLGPLNPSTDPNDQGPVRTYGHIVVDEAQDLSPMELRMLARRSISGSMTVVGDVAQATGAEAPAGWDEVVRHLSPRRQPVMTELSVNYRTPSEIMDVAAAVLALAEPDLVPPRSVRSTGVEPLVVRAGAESDLVRAVADAALAELAAVEGGTVAIIASDRSVEALRSGLAPRLAAAGVELGVPERDGLDLPVTLVPARLVKGLEFDAVVVVEPAALVEDSAQGLRTVYVALTRATRRLAVVHARPLPEVLEGQLARVVNRGREGEASSRDFQSVPEPTASR